MKCIFNIFVLAISCFAFAQTEQLPKLPKQGFHDIKVGVNLFRTASAVFGSGKDTYEIQGSFGVDKANFVVDIGMEDNKRFGSYTYNNSGNYFRIGYDRNFIKRVSTGNILSLGLRYARASFEDQLIYSLDNGFGVQNLNFTNQDLKARWIELVFSIRGRIVAQLYTGFSLRWKFSRKVSGEDILRTFDIPGFGTTKRDNATSFDYYIMWRIPTKKLLEPIQN